MKTSTAMVSLDPWGVVWIYEGVDPVTFRAFYVGQTNNFGRRNGEHDRSSEDNALIRERIRLGGFKFKDVARIVPELPNGVPKFRADEFESYFIVHRKTLYDPSSTDPVHFCCNRKHGNGVERLDYKAVEEELKKGYEWPEREEVVSDEINKARAEEALFRMGVELVGDFDPSVHEDLSKAIEKRKGLEWALLSATAVAEEIAKEYEALNPFEEVPRNVFIKNVNVVRDKLNEEEEPSAKMLSLCRSVSMFGKDEGEEWEMQANVAVHAFKMIAGALAAREEAKIPESKTKKEMMEARKWSAANEWKKPTTQSEEAMRLCSALGRWKFTGMPDKGAADFIMRNVTWYKEYVNYSRKDAGEKIEEDVKAMLEEGYGYSEEPDFEGKKKWPCGARGTDVLKVYKCMNNIVRGEYPIEKVRRIVSGIGERGQWYIQQAESNRPARLEQAAKYAAEAKARGHLAKPKKESSLPVTKKQKTA